MIALDASALLAFMFREPGHEYVASLIEDSCMSSVNMAEVLGRFERDGHAPRQVAQALRSTSIEFVDFDENHAEMVATLVPTTQPYGLSLADRACLALAASRGIPAITADRVWADIKLGVDVQLIRD